MRERKPTIKNTGVKSQIVLTGLTNRRVAEELGVSEKTLSAYINGRLGTGASADLTGKLKIFLDKFSSQDNSDLVSETKEMI